MEEQCKTMSRSKAMSRQAGCKSKSVSMKRSEILEDWSGSLKSGEVVQLKILPTLIIWDYDLY